MAETNALLKRHTGNCIEGSNPSVSATELSKAVHTRPGAHIHTGQYLQIGDYSRINCLRASMGSQVQMGVEVRGSDGRGYRGLTDAQVKAARGKDADYRLADTGG